MLVKLSVVVLAMFGFGYALVPLYNKICQATGYGRNFSLLEQKATVANTQVDPSRWVTVEFDANSRGDVPWQLSPIDRKVRVHPGQLVSIAYEIRNPTPVSVAGQAIVSYGPQLAGLYVKKLECFCFSTQEIRAGETRRLPVVFVIDPKLPREVNTITLSYTMFEVGGTHGGTAAAAAAKG